MKLKIQYIIVVLTLTSCIFKKKENSKIIVNEIERIYYEPRDMEGTIDFEDNNLSIEHFVTAVNSAKKVGLCKFYPKAWVIIINKSGKAKKMRFSNHHFKFDDDICFKIPEHYQLDFLNYDSRIIIQSIKDIKDLKKRGLGYSTFGTSKEKFEVQNPLNNFGAYQIFDTTELNEIHFLGQLDVMTDIEIPKLKYDNEEELVISFSTRSERIYFGAEIGIGFNFSPHKHNNVEEIGLNEYQFKKGELDFIISTNFDKEIIYIIAGEYECKL